MSEFKDKLAAVRLNPGLMMNVTLNELERQLNGTATYDVPDASSPFVASLETAVLMSSLAMSEGLALLRKQYPSMALTADELYLHMSDDDFLGRFSNPAQTYFELYIDKAEILSKVVPYGDAGARKLVIPRLTQFNVAGYKFTMQYPIEIRVMAHGGIQIVYDADELSPLQTLESNLVDFQEVPTKTVTLLLLKIPVFQFKVDTYVETLNSTTAFDTSYQFTDQFYYARVFVQRPGQTDWTEINTTHSDQTYNPTRITAMLKVVNNNLFVSIPVIYNTAGLVEGELRIDIYTTVGEVDVDMGSYPTVEVNFNDIDDDRTYTAPLTTFNQLQALNPNRVSGGSDAMSFDELRDAVINNTTGANSQPITDSQLTAALVTKGYGLVTNVDNITDMQFLASRRLANPTNGTVIAGAGCLMGQLQLQMEQIASSKYVKDNGSRLTVLPSMLYQYLNGRVNLVPDAVIDRLRSASAEAVQRATIDNRYLYSPLHYVLDASGDNFDVRAYYLDQPKILRKVFFDENDTTQLQASVDSYGIERTVDGYRLTVKLKSSDRFKTIDDELVVVQMGYKPIGETQWASVNGVLLGIDNDERVYEFDITTDYDINAQNGFYTTNMSMYDQAQVDFALNLTHDLAFTVCVNESITPGYKAGPMDLLVQGHLLNTNFMVIGRELLTVQFGLDMTMLWHRNRTILSETNYQKWEADVLYYYEENIYQRDANGQIIIKNNNGKLEYTVLHRKGDPVMDPATNTQVKRYIKGDVKLDANGEPLLVTARKVVREYTLFLIDGLYYFATETGSVAYRDSIALELQSWLASDLATIQKNLLNKGKLYLYPTTTIGDTTALVKEGLKASVNIDQSLNIAYYMPEKSYNSASLRAPLIKSTKQLINGMLSKSTISVSDIISKLKLNGGDDVAGIEVNGLGGDVNYTIITLLDPAVRLALRKKLTVLANNELMVEDDINISFLKHSG